jgi:hypothetical protein
MSEYEDLIIKLTNSSVASSTVNNWSQSILMLIVNFIMFSLCVMTLIIIWNDIPLQPSMIAMTITYTLLLTDVFNYLVEEITDL